MAPYSEFLETTLCEYFDHTLSCTDGITCFQWRIVHCQRPAISAIEILDMNGLLQLIRLALLQFQLRTKLLMLRKFQLTMRELNALF